MNLEELQGRTVIVIENGQNMGQVVDAALDLAGHRLVALLVASGGLIGSTRHSLEVGRIFRIGRDAVMVQALADIADGHELAPGNTRMSELRRRGVVTESGENAGSLRDLEVSDDYRITGIEVATMGRLLGVFGSTTAVPIEQVRAFGELIVVKDDALPNREQ